MFKKLYFLRFTIFLGKVVIKFGDRVLNYLGGCKLTVINKRRRLTIPGRFKRNIKIVALPQGVFPIISVSSSDHLK